MKQPETRPEQTEPVSRQLDKDKDKELPSAREFIQQENKSPDDFE